VGVDGKMGHRSQQGVDYTMTDLTVTPGARLTPAANNAVGMDGRVINLPAALIGQSGQMRLEAQVLGQDPDGLWLLQTGAGLVRLSVTDGGLERGQRLLLQLNFAGANSTGRIHLGRIQRPRP
jgi:hypothetical protein